MVLYPGLSLAQHRGHTMTSKEVAYALALSAADQFLTAWQFRRQDDGLALISDSVKQKNSEEDLRTYISGLSNPHHESFEICCGDRLKDGRFSFDVTLYEDVTGDNTCSSRSAKIIVVEESKGVWLVDSLPYPTDQRKSTNVLRAK